MIETSNAALITFLAYLVGVFVLAFLAERMARGKEFVGEYFLGSRNFGMWTFAMTFAATSSSGGSFMGFPALIYTHGWVLAFWIAGYMVVPLVSMGLLAKRLNKVARRCRAVTLPEVLRERFGSSAVGMVATLVVVFFMFFYLLAQFKAGGKILSTLLGPEPAFQSMVAGMARVTSGLPWLNQAEPEYLLCLMMFSVSVIVYVVYGGFRAVVWTDVMQGIIMFLGVVIMIGLALAQVGGLGKATRAMARMTPPVPGLAVLSLGVPLEAELKLRKGTWFRQDGKLFRLAEFALFAPGVTNTAPLKVIEITTPAEVAAIAATPTPVPVALRVTESTPYAAGAGRPGGYVSAPGPSPLNASGFLALGTAFSFFIFWPFGGAGQPGNLVRLMAFKDTPTLRRSIVMVVVYYSIIYFALVVIFCCARVLMPGMEIDPDRVMPEFASLLSRNAGMPWLAGLLVAAPFAAVMSSVDSFLLVVSSSVVRDIYQQHINPRAPERTVRWLSYTVTAVVGVAALFAVVNPPRYLQDLIVFASGGLAGCLLIPLILALYWPRLNAAGAIAGMLGGLVAHMALTLVGYLKGGGFQAHELLGLGAFIWDVIGSAGAAWMFTATGSPTRPETVRRFF